MDDFDDFMANWPECPIDGCTNKISLSLASDKYFVHTPGNDHVKRWKIEARNASLAQANE